MKLIQSVFLTLVMEKMQLSLMEYLEKAKLK